MGVHDAEPTFVTTDPSRVMVGEVETDQVVGSTVDVRVSNARVLHGCAALGTPGHYGLAARGQTAIVTEAAAETGVIESMPTPAPAGATVGECGMRTDEVTARVVPGATEDSFQVRDFAGALTLLSTDKTNGTHVTAWRSTCARVDALVSDSVAPTAVGAFPYVVLATDGQCDVTLGAGAVLANLPTAIGCAGRKITFKIVATGGGNLSVTPFGAQQIDLAGAGVPYVLTVLNSSVTIKSNGAGWDVVALQPFNANHAANHLNAGADPVRVTVRTPAAGACAIVVGDHHVRAASLGAGAVAATLYAADAAAVGRVVTVIKVDVAADDVNVTPFGAELINGANAAFPLAAQWNSVTLLCVAVGQWEVIA